MRVDKYLQISGLVKRRVTAQRLCDAGRVRIGDRRAKPSSEVAPGDVLEVVLGERRRRVRVLSLPASPREAARATPYEDLEAGRSTPPPHTSSYRS
ncbi:MAG: S4 domain-containing protein [bacterium]